MPYCVPPEPIQWSQVISSVYRKKKRPMERLRGTWSHEKILINIKGAMWKAMSDAAAKSFSSLIQGPGPTTRITTGHDHSTETTCGGTGRSSAFRRLILLRPRAWHHQTCHCGRPTNARQLGFGPSTKFYPIAPYPVVHTSHPGIKISTSRDSYK